MEKRPPPLGVHPIPPVVIRQVMRQGRKPTSSQARRDSVEIATEHPAAAWVAELAEGLRLDLPDALACDTELSTDLFECPELTVLQAVAEHYNTAVALRKAAQRLSLIHI